MNHHPFEDFLKDWHMRNYQGTDDDAPDAFDAWLVELEPEQLIKIGDLAMREAELRGYNRATEFAIKTLKDAA